MQRSRRKQHVTDFDRVISQPISNQTQIRQSSPAATERQPQRCTRSIPYCQRTIHDARPWPASFRLPCSRTEYIITSTALAATAPARAKAMTRLFRRAYHRERVDAAVSALTLALHVQRKLHKVIVGRNLGRCPCCDVDEHLTSKRHPAEVIPIASLLYLARRCL